MGEGEAAPLQEQMRGQRMKYFEYHTITIYFYTKSIK